MPSVVEVWTSFISLDLKTMSWKSDHAISGFSLVQYHRHFGMTLVIAATQLSPLQPHTPRYRTANQSYIDFERPTHRPRCPSSPQTLGMARDWLQTCLSSKITSHEACNRGRIVGWSPTRVIQLSVEDPSMWYLRIPGEDALEVPNYLTLSYRWGTDPFTRLTMSNIRAFRRGTKTSILPKTFQDAMKVTKALGFEFLWIDALCIIQDSEEDWRKESLTMYNVYKNSTCNIAATASHNPYEGLFHQSSSNRGKLGSIKATWSNLNDSFAPLEQVDTVVGFHHASEEIDTSPLASRAWIFQELYLAPRILHFLESQIYWRCLAGSKSETFPNGLLDAPVWDKIDFEENRREGIPLSHSWECVIKFYSRCSATVSTDKLIALSGIAKFFEVEIADQYIAGMWKGYLDTMLNWKVSDPVTVRPRPTPYRAPSWSWASIDSAVDYWEPSLESPNSLITILNVNTETIGDDPTGHVIGGALTLRGVAKEFRFGGPVSSTGDTTWLLDDQAYVSTVRFDIVDESLTSEPLHFLATHAYCRRAIGSKIYHYPFKVCGSVLRKCQTPAMRYVRVGYFEMKFGLPKSEGKEPTLYDLMMFGFDGRLDAPNSFRLAESFGFEERDENSMGWNKPLLQEFEIV